MDTSRLEPGNLPAPPDQVLQDIAISTFKSKLRSANDAVARAYQNAEQITVNSTARQYAGQQLRRAASILAEAQGILVEHGCTIDLELDSDADEATQDAQIDQFLNRVFGQRKGGAS